MIQPISAFSPRAGYRGSNETNRRGSGITSTQVGMINAAGVAVASGGLMTAIARSHTSSWASAALVGTFGSVIALFFMTPQIIGKNNKLFAKKQVCVDDARAFVKDEVKVVAKQNCLKPQKIIIPFKQSS